MTSHLTSPIGSRGNRNCFLPVGDKGRSLEEKRAERIRRLNDKSQKKYSYGLQEDANKDCKISILHKSPNRHGMGQFSSIGKSKGISERFSRSIGPITPKEYDAKNPEWDMVKEKKLLKEQRAINLAERRARKKRKKENNLK